MEQDRGTELSSDSEIAPVRVAPSRRMYWLPGATLIIGLVITAVLVVLTHSVYVHNERRLLRLRLRDAASVITAIVPGIQTPLASAAELADATGGDVAKFRRFITPYATGKTKQFASVSLWRISSTQAVRVSTAGLTPELTPAQALPFLTAAVHSPSLSVMGLLSDPSPRLGYAFGTPGGAGPYVAYGESVLAPRRHSPVQRDSAFAGLNFGLYLGTTQNQRDLLAASAPLPLRGPKAVLSVPFGDSAITMAMTAQGSLSGTLPQELPWIIALAGALLSLAAAGLVLRLTQRQMYAERLAVDLEISATANRQLYAEQRSIAQTLQHALLPESLPEVPGIEADARYHAGERSVDIGGDWYDVISLSHGRLLVVVGDVSGRGLKAGTTMAALRYAIHAYAAQDDPPETILHKLSGMISVVHQGQLATVLCARIDVEQHEVCVTSAGHLPPLLIAAGEARFVDSPVGLPIGVEAGATYGSTIVKVPPRATLLGFTDGLVERRGENLDIGLERLRAAAVADVSPLAQMLDNLVQQLSDEHDQDDIAIVGMRWTS